MHFSPVQPKLSHTISSLENGSISRHYQQWKFLLLTMLTDNDHHFLTCLQWFPSVLPYLLYFPRKLNALHIDRNMLFVFSDSFVKSVMMFGLVCWWGNLSVKNREKLNRIYKISCKIAMCCTPDTSLEQLYKSRTLQMATKMLSDPTHFLHDHYDLLPPGWRYRMPTVKIQRALTSFIPSSIKYMNQPQILIVDLSQFLLLPMQWCFIIVIN